MKNLAMEKMKKMKRMENWITGKIFFKRKLFAVLARITIVLLLLAASLNVGAAYARTMLVTQPAFPGMRFYVHQPQGVPANWLVTFDGYPVQRGGNGVWIYGSYSNGNITSTNYIVGSVVPSMVGIRPFPPAVNVLPSPVMPAHVMPTHVMPVSVITAPIAVRHFPAAHQFPVAVPPLAVRNDLLAPHPSPSVVSFPTVAPSPFMASTHLVAAPVFPAAAWTIDPNFMLLGTWRSSVDRVGILARPSIPVAWRGESPSVIYAWTGWQWFQIIVREGDRPRDVLRSNLHLLTRLVHQNGNRQWQAPDITFLVSQTAFWGYAWMGQIGPDPRWLY